VATIPDIILLADPGQGLNAAVARGIAWARSVAPGNPVAALTGDLPCLLSEDLAAGLEAARRHRLAVVPDRSGTGSTMISALSGVPVTPHFGAQSCRAHVLAGHRPLTVPGFSTLRADVDTLEDLDQALRRGVGQHTRAVGPRSPALASSSDHGGLPLPYLSTA
jgi:2-phospho-L-lactate guanylyltransferase